MSKQTTAQIQLFQCRQDAHCLCALVARYRQAKPEWVAALEYRNPFYTEAREIVMALLMKRGHEVTDVARALRVDTRTVRRAVVRVRQQTRSDVAYRREWGRLEQALELIAG